MRVRILRLSLALTVLLGFQGCHVLRYPTRWEDAPPIEPGSGVAPGDPAKDLPSLDPPETRTPVRTRDQNEVETLLALARDLVGTRGPLVVSGRQFPFDCSGFVSALYYQLGRDLSLSDDGQGGSATSMIFRKLQSEGRLFSEEGEPGDLVFFDNTYDRDNDGTLNDELSHVGVVEERLPSGTLVVLHLGNSGIGRIHINLRWPDVYRDEKSGEILNHKLRRTNRSDPAGTLYLTGQLFRAFGRVD